VDTGAEACLAPVASHRTAFWDESRSAHPKPCLRTATARPWQLQPRAASPTADPRGSIGGGPWLWQPRRPPEGRLDPGAGVARPHAHCSRPRERVRIRGPALSLADGDCRTDHRGALVGTAVFWRDQASTRFAPCRGEPLTKPTHARRGGTVRCA